MRGEDKGLIQARVILLDPDSLATSTKGLDSSEDSKSSGGKDRGFVEVKVFLLGPDHLTTARLDSNREVVLLRSPTSHEGCIRKGWPTVCRRAEGDATQEEEQHEA